MVSVDNTVSILNELNQTNLEKVQTYARFILSEQIEDEYLFRPKNSDEVYSEIMDARAGSDAGIRRDAFVSLAEFREKYHAV